jgi:peroxiredoxin
MKNTLLFILSLFFITSTFAQKKTIVATIIGFKDQTKVKLFDQELQELIDSTYLINNKFTLTHKNNSSVPKNLSLVLIPEGGPTAIDLYIANENIKISGDEKNFPYNLTISGSKHQDLKNILNQKIKTVLDERNELVKLVKKSEADSSVESKQQKKEVSEKIDKIDIEYENITKKFIKENINSYVALDKLEKYKTNYSKEDLKNLYSNLDEEYKKCKLGISLLNYIEIGEIVKEGDLYSDFEAKDKNGKTHKLSDYKGQFIILDFTMEYCAPCEAAIKELKIIDERFDEKIKIISFTREKSESYWQKGLVRNEIKWLSLWDGQGGSGKTLMKYGVSGVPDFFFINPEGKITKHIVGYSKNVLVTEIEKNIK